MWKPEKPQIVQDKTFEIIVTNTGAASASIDKSSSADGMEIVKALYPFLFRAAIII